MFTADSCACDAAIGVMRLPLNKIVPVSFRPNAQAHLLKLAVPSSHNQLLIDMYTCEPGSTLLGLVEGPPPYYI